MMYVRGDLRLSYSDDGDRDAWPVLLLAPGGMRSQMERWTAAPWNPLVRLPEYRRIAMDQRNAGDSTGPVLPDHGWATYLQDQLALLDHLGVRRFHVVGMCIGGPYALQLVRAVPERVLSAVLLQPIGLSADNRGMFHELFDAWAKAIGPQHPGADWARFRAAMFDGDFVFAMGRDEVRRCARPTLVLAGNDRYHPTDVSREIAALAPQATLIEGWKEDLGAADRQIRAFLARHTPTAS